jgi:DNA-binding transcriptional MerR regulator
MEKQYDIDELSRECRTSRRNIHFYVQQKILAPPVSAGVGARYSDEHRLRLLAIPVLRLQGLRLDAIRDYFASSTTEEIAQLVANVTPTAPEAVSPPPASNVLRYELAEGVELLVDATLGNRTRDRVQELLAVSRAIFTK